VLRSQWPTEFLPPLPRVRKSMSAPSQPHHSLQHDLGLNFADSIDLVFALEDMFEIEVPDQDFRKFTAVSEVIRYVEGRLQPT